MARGKSGDGPNKMQLVRDALGALGPKAKPKAVQAHVQEASGLLLSASMISSYKSLIKNGNKGKGKGRKPGRPAKDESAAVAKSESKSGANIAADIVLIRKLIGRLGARQVSDLIDVLK